MNKQETIKKLESIKAIGNDAIAACYNESINAGITLMKKIDEPQKPVVPKFVADWYEHHKHKTLEAKFMHIENAADDRVVNWYEKCKGRHNNPRGNSQETLAMMDLFGYTVEQPKRWVVKNDRGYVAMENFEDFNTCRVGVRMSIVDKKSEGSAWDDVDRKKAEAVATLVDGSVEEV